MKSTWLTRGSILRFLTISACLDHESVKTCNGERFSHLFFVSQAS